MEKEKLLEMMEYHIKGQAGEIVEKFRGVDKVLSLKELFAEMVGMCDMYMVATSKNGMGDYFGSVVMAMKELRKACETNGVEFQEVCESLL